MINNLIGVLDMIPEALMDEETSNGLKDKLNSGVEKDMQSAWNAIYGGAMEGLTYAGDRKSVV